jgi:hypothetical protein
VPLSVQSATGNAAQNILRAWTVLEVLSPVTFRAPADLAGRMGKVARFDRGLPWQNAAAKGRPASSFIFRLCLARF